MSDTTGVSSVFGVSVTTGGVVSAFVSIVSVTVFCTASPVRVVSTDPTTGDSDAGADSTGAHDIATSGFVGVTTSESTSVSSVDMSVSRASSSCFAVESSFSRSSRTWSA